MPRPLGHWVTGWLGHWVVGSLSHWNRVFAIAWEITGSLGSQATGSPGCFSLGRWVTRNGFLQSLGKSLGRWVARPLGHWVIGWLGHWVTGWSGHWVAGSLGRWVTGTDFSQLLGKTQWSPSGTPKALFLLLLELLELQKLYFYCVWGLRTSATLHESDPEQFRTSATLHGNARTVSKGQKGFQN